MDEMGCVLYDGNIHSRYVPSLVDNSVQRGRANEANGHNGIQLFGLLLRKYGRLADLPR